MANPYRMRRRLLRAGAAWLTAAAMLTAGIPGSPASTGNGLRRWFGAEGGFDEVACSTPGSGCPGLSAVTSFGGQLQTVHTMSELMDPDGQRRPWPARTGSKLFLAKTQTGSPSAAYLSTAGATASPLTVSFGLRFHAPPVDPVVVFRHAGTSPGQTIALALTPGAELIATGGSKMLDPTGLVLATGRWHAITLTYQAGAQGRFKLYVDGSTIVDAILPLGGPSGTMDIGIVAPSLVPSQIGIDDFVQADGFDAPIRGARINYLMPVGGIGSGQWTRTHPSPGCWGPAQNWQMVTEDQSMQAGGETCGLEAGSLTTQVSNRTDLYTLEGVPSSHVPSPSYFRDLGMQPGPADPVLGVRMRMRGRTGGGDLSWGLAYVDQGVTVREALAFDDGGTGGSQMVWSSTSTQRPGGSPWTAAALHGLRLRLDSGEGSGVRIVDDVRLDYVWVP